MMTMMKVVKCLANEQDDCDDRQGQTLKGDPPPQLVGPPTRTNLQAARHTPHTSWM